MTHPSLIEPHYVTYAERPSFPLGVAELDTADPTGRPARVGEITVFGADASTDEQRQLRADLSAAIRALTTAAANDTHNVVVVLSCVREAEEVLERLRADGIAESVLISQIRIAHTRSASDMVHAVATVASRRQKIAACVVLDLGAATREVVSIPGSFRDSRTSALAVLRDLAQGDVRTAYRRATGRFPDEDYANVTDQQAMVVLASARLTINHGGYGSGRHLHSLVSSAASLFFDCGTRRVRKSRHFPPAANAAQ